jgi:hypothetical protein
MSKAIPASQATTLTKRRARDGSQNGSNRWCGGRSIATGCSAAAIRLILHDLGFGLFPLTPPGSEENVELAHRGVDAINRR